MLKKIFAVCLFIAAASGNGTSQSIMDNTLSEVTLEEMSQKLVEAQQQVDVLLTELESRIVSDTLTQADLIVVVNSLLELDSPEGYELILKYSRRYIRKPRSTSDLAYTLGKKNPKPFYTIWTIFQQRVNYKQIYAFRDYLYHSDYLHKPIPEEDLTFIQCFLRDFPDTDHDEFQKVRAENLRRIREQN